MTPAGTLLLEDASAEAQDVFAAIAEPKRRAMLGFLAQGERPVGEIALALSMEQPAASKHLRVLKEAQLVGVRKVGRRRLYRTNAEALKPVQEWAATFDRYWQTSLEGIKAKAERKQGSKNKGA